MAIARVTKWLRGDNLALIEAWSRRGLNQDEIARRMGISRKTLQRWREEHEELQEALERGREAADALVEGALLKRAIGCRVTEERWGYPPGEEEPEDEGNGGRTLVLLGRTVKEIPPDVKAATFWLTNRIPESWKSKQPEEEKQGAEINVAILPPAQGPE